MSLWNLTLTEMLGITSTFLEKGGLRARLDAHPLLAALLPSLDHVHAQAASISAVSPASEVEKELAALSQEGQALDSEQHDRIVRGVYNLCEGLAELAGAGDDANDYRALGARILPQGLATGQQSWSGEAGNASRLSRALSEDKEFRNALSAIKLPRNRSLLTEVEALIRVGHRLGAIELRRAELRSSTSKSTEESVAVVSVGAARKAWVDAVETFRGLLKMPRSNVPSELRDAVLALLDDAERKGDARARQRVAARSEGADAPEADKGTPTNGASPASPSAPR